MKLFAWNHCMRILMVTGIAAAIGLSACGKKEPPAEVKSAAVTLKKAFDVPPGADPSVPAEMGGAGFEKIAADSGWKTSTLTPDEIQLVADSNAKKGGSISMGVDEYPATFRAYGKDENTEVTRAIHDMVYESLLATNPLNLDFMPSLATHWKVGADNQTYYFRINPNARFSDGHPVTSEDVLATYKLGTDATILAPYTNTFFQGFDPPVAISKYIVSIRSKTNNWKNMFYIANSLILPAHVIGKITGKEYLEKYQYEMPPGSGPYTVLSEDIKKGNSVTVTRRADWWAKDDPLDRGQNNFDKIKFVVVRDENLRQQKFLKGELDFCSVNRASYWVEKFNTDECKRGLIQKRKVFNDKPTGFGGVAFNTQRAPFNDPKVRMAFTLLFNRKDLVDKLMYGEYVLSDSYYPNTVYANPNNPKQQYDPARAAQLLNEAGYTSRNSEGILVKDGKPLEIEMIVSQEQVRIVTPYQQDLQKAGIKLTLRQMDPTTRFTMTTEKNFTIAFSQWGGLIYPNPISSFHSKLLGPNSNNITGFHNARADELIDREQVTFDQAERVKIIRELDSILVAENTYALAYHVPYARVAYWDKFGTPPYVLGRINDWEQALTLWWYDPAKAATLEKAKADKSMKIEDGPVDNKFWPDWDAKHPPAVSTAATAVSAKPAQAKPATGAKPSLK